MNKNEIIDSLLEERNQLKFTVGKLFQIIDNYMPMEALEIFAIENLYFNKDEDFSQAGSKAKKILELMKKGSEYEMKTYNNIHNNNIQSCETCMKKDVCKYKEEYNKLLGKINTINQQEIINKPFEVTLKCKEWFENKNYRKAIIKSETIKT